jgi:hypothetical protein
MKSKLSRHFHFLLWIILFLAGTSTGAQLQKEIGIGNVLRRVGIPYPTSAPASTSPGKPVVDIPPAHKGKLSLFILAGQSNMVGWAPLPEDVVTDPRLYVFSNDYHWRVASDPIDDAYNQVDQVSLDRIAFFGPSMSFALASLERRPQVVIGLIPCAKNSSAIGQWQRDLSDQSLYGSCLKRAFAASPMGELSGILFFQGEADAVDPNLEPEPEPNASDWAVLFTQFVTDFRKDLGQPELPIVFAQLGSTSAMDAFTNWELVKEQQLAVELPMTAMITTDDLPLLDGVHFTAESYINIGRRFADAYWELIELQQGR